MSFDLEELRRHIACHGQVIRVVVADTRGSVPREVGAAMLVWPGGQSGTIGGGALEFEAARQALAGRRGVSQHPLGPALGQCCGGSVTLWTEDWDSARLDRLDVSAGLIAQGDGPRPLSVNRAMAQMRSGVSLRTHLQDGWLIEPLKPPTRPLWIYGAGHVGRAIVAIMSDLPGAEITWLDTSADRFPDPVPDSASQLVAADLARAVPHAADMADHLILTYSHALDLDLCHALLSRRTGRIGLIGSATKWARFRKRLGELGHSRGQIDRIDCPIGDPTLGKHPQAIAISVAASWLKDGHAQAVQQRA